MCRGGGEYLLNLRPRLLMLEQMKTLVLFWDMEADGECFLGLFEKGIWECGSGLLFY